MVSALALVEVPAALWRKHRAGEIDAETAAILIRLFDVELAATDGAAPTFVVVGATTDVLVAAARLTGTRGLRGYDAVQLASALAVRAVDPDCGTFACFDRGLRAAAIAEGLTAYP